MRYHDITVYRYIFLFKMNKKICVHRIANGVGKKTISFNSKKLLNWYLSSISPKFVREKFWPIPIHRVVKFFCMQTLWTVVQIGRYTLNPRQIFRAYESLVSHPEGQTKRSRLKSPAVSHNGEILSSPHKKVGVSCECLYLFFFFFSLS